MACKRRQMRAVLARFLQESEENISIRISDGRSTRRAVVAMVGGIVEDLRRCEVVRDGERWWISEGEYRLTTTPQEITEFLFQVLRIRNRWRNSLAFIFYN